MKMEIYEMNTIKEMLKQSLILMVLGMSIVFVFLYIIIFFINLFHKILKIVSKNNLNENIEGIITNEKDEKNEDDNNKIKGADNIIIDNNTVTAIMTAIKLYERETDQNINLLTN